MINVTFAPTALGPRAGTLTVTDSAGGSPHTVPLTGTGWDFTVAAPATVTVKSGATGTFNVTITPLGGFNQAVTVTCTGATMPTTCTPTSPVTPAGTPVMSVVTISAKGMILPPPSMPRPPMSIRQIVPLLLALSLLLCLFMTRRLQTRLGMVTAIVILLALAGCGGGGSKTSTTNLTITASSGGVNKTATVALTIN
jgi:hypothetical protein